MTDKELEIILQWMINYRNLDEESIKVLPELVGKPAVVTDMAYLMNSLYDRKTTMIIREIGIVEHALVDKGVITKKDLAEAAKIYDDTTSKKVSNVKDKVTKAKQKAEVDPKLNVTNKESKK